MLSMFYALPFGPVDHHLVGSGKRALLLFLFGWRRKHAAAEYQQQQRVSKLL